MSRKLIFPFVACLLLVLANCTKDIGKKPVTTVSINACDSITYNKQIKPIIINNCAIPSCHVAGGTGPGDFTIFDALKEKVTSGKFKARVFDGSPTFMPAPPAPPLPAAQLALLKCWMDKGANND